jgi:excinuclease UvrABC nuclease subunit
MSTDSWSLGNGQYLNFGSYDINSTTWNEVPGLYIFTYSDGRFWQPLYIGQAEDFRKRMTSHERFEEAVQKGATHIHATVVQQAANRDRWEKMLIEAHQPPMNVQYRNLSRFAY